MKIGSFPPMHVRCKARRADRDQKGRPDVNLKINIHMYMGQPASRLFVEFFVLNWSVRPLVRTFLFITCYLLVET